MLRAESRSSETAEDRVEQVGRPVSSGEGVESVYGVRRQYPMRAVLYSVLITAFVAIVLIAQRNYRHALWLREQALQKELGDLRSESVVLGAELMQMGQESEVRERIAEQGIPLRSPTGPAMVIKRVK